MCLLNPSQLPGLLPELPHPGATGFGKADHSQGSTPALPCCKQMSSFEASNPHGFSHQHYGTRPALPQPRIGHTSTHQLRSVFCGPQVSGTKPSFSVCTEYLLLAPRIKLTNFLFFQTSKVKKKKKKSTKLENHNGSLWRVRVWKAQANKKLIRRKWVLQSEMCDVCLILFLRAEQGVRNMPIQSAETREQARSLCLGL